MTEITPLLGPAVSIAIAVVGGAVGYGIMKAGVASANAKASEAEKKADLAIQELSEFRERVAREYATQRAIVQMEGRLIAAIERLGDRLDSLFTPRAPRPR